MNDPAEFAKREMTPKEKYEQRKAQRKVRQQGINSPEDKAAAEMLEDAVDAIDRLATAAEMIAEALRK